MARINFLTKLKEEGKLSIVEPNENIKDAYMKKSASNLSSARILLENKKYEESVSMAYYGMYHLLTALLFKNGIKCENHAASIIILKEIFGIDNTKISDAKKERIDKQYYVEFSIKEEDAKDMMKIAEEFEKQILEFISKETNADTGKYRNILSSKI